MSGSGVALAVEADGSLGIALPKRGQDDLALGCGVAQASGLGCLGRRVQDVDERLAVAHRLSAGRLLEGAEQAADRFLAGVTSRHLSVVCRLRPLLAPREVWNARSSQSMALCFAQGDCRSFKGPVPTRGVESQT